MANGKVKEIGQDDFVQLLDEHTDRPLVVDVFATWCAPCRMAAPAFEKFATKYGEATFVKVDADKEPGIAGASLRVAGFPRSSPSCSSLSGSSCSGSPVGSPASVPTRSFPTTRSDKSSPPSPISRNPHQGRYAFI